MVSRCGDAGTGFSVGDGVVRMFHMGIRRSDVAHDILSEWVGE